MGLETDQLLAAANHYLAEAKNVLRSHSGLADSTIGDVTARHRAGPSLSPGELALAHLASAAVRLATCCEIHGYQPTQHYRVKFYERSGERKNGWLKRQIIRALSTEPNQHLHLLLRDNVAHEEPGIRNTKHIAEDRKVALKSTTLGACVQALDEIARVLDRDWD
jgi:hypothetical protein